VLLALGVLTVLWPQLLALPFAGLSIWLAGALFLRAYRLSRTRAPSREARYGPPARHAHRDCAPGPEDGP